MGAISSMVIDVQINVCTIMLSSTKHIENWMQLIWGLFAIGGVIGPLIVYLCGNKTYIVIGILSFLISISYIYL